MYLLEKNIQRVDRVEIEIRYFFGIKLVWKWYIFEMKSNQPHLKSELGETEEEEKPKSCEDILNACIYEQEVK